MTSLGCMHASQAYSSPMEQAYDEKHGQLSLHTIVSLTASLLDGWTVSTRLPTCLKCHYQQSTFYPDFYTYWTFLLLCGRDGNGASPAILDGFEQWIIQLGLDNNSAWRHPRVGELCSPTGWLRIWDGWSCVGELCCRLLFVWGTFVWMWNRRRPWWCVSHTTVGLLCASGPRLILFDGLVKKFV